MNQKTKKLIDKYSPMWTNKQIWEFDQLNEELSFDLVYVEPGNYDESLWKSKSSFPESEFISFEILKAINEISIVTIRIL